jgi:hypothetical protein
MVLPEPLYWMHRHDCVYRRLQSGPLPRLFSRFPIIHSQPFRPWSRTLAKVVNQFWRECIANGMGLFLYKAYQSSIRAGDNASECESTCRRCLKCLKCCILGPKRRVQHLHAQFLFFRCPFVPCWPSILHPDLLRFAPKLLGPLRFGSAAWAVRDSLPRRNFPSTSAPTYPGKS